MPAAEKVSKHVQESDLGGNASKEAVRRMLRGKTVPQVGENAEAVFVALSQMAGVDPDRLVTVESDHRYGPEGEPEPARSVFQRYWRDARGGGDFAHEPMEDYPPPPPSRGGGFSDEPPF
ncbi:hypothetical protein GCM10009834_02250 [Streptomonospora arabica]